MHERTIADFGLRIEETPAQRYAGQMNSEKMKQRTKALALRIVRLVDTLPSRGSAGVMGRQLLRCGTSVGANYRAACRGRSRRDFVAKLGIIEEECDEVIYWLELLTEAGIVAEARPK